ncbi:hypothetical protein BH18THE2_BH18THE2_07740 [soil metagenome]
MEEYNFHHWSGVPNAYGRITFSGRKMYPTLDPNVIYTEFRPLHANPKLQLVINRRFAVIIQASNWV